MLRFIALSVLSSVLSFSCGSGGDGGSGGQTPPQENPDLSGGSGQPLNCDAAWKSYVSSHPAGLKLRYETSGSGQLEFHTTEVTSSNDSAVTETYRSSSAGTSETTTTKEQFLSTCRQGVPTTPNQPSTGTVEESKKTTIRVKAGEFNTNYIRMRSIIDRENDVTAVSEVWTSDNNYHFLVKQITTTELSGERYEVKTELIEAHIP